MSATSASEFCVISIIHMSFGIVIQVCSNFVSLELVSVSYTLMGLCICESFPTTGQSDWSFLTIYLSWLIFICHLIEYRAKFDKSYLSLWQVNPKFLPVTDKVLHTALMDVLQWKFPVTSTSGFVEFSCNQVLVFIASYSFMVPTSNIHTKYIACHCVKIHLTL